MQTLKRKYKESFFVETSKYHHLMGNDHTKTRQRRPTATQIISISTSTETFTLPSLQNSQTLQISCSRTPSHSNPILPNTTPTSIENNSANEEPVHKSSLTPNSINEYKDEYKDYDTGPRFVMDDDEEDDDIMPIPSLCIINHTSETSSFADPHWTNISSDANNSCTTMLFCNSDDHETKNNLDKKRFQNYLSDNISNNELLVNRFNSDTDICATHTKNSSKVKYIFLTLKNRTKNLTKKIQKTQQKMAPLQLQQSRSLTIHQINQHNERMNRRKNFKIMNSIIPENDRVSDFNEINICKLFSSSAPVPTLNINNSNEKHSCKRKKCEIQNGITGCYISDKIARTAALFWGTNIDILKRKQHLNIGCDMYFWMYDNHQELQHFFEKEKLEQTALRFLDMVAFFKQIKFCVF